MCSELTKNLNAKNIAEVNAPIFLKIMIVSEKVVA